MRCLWSALFVYFSLSIHYSLFSLSRSRWFKFFACMVVGCSHVFIFHVRILLFHPTMNAQTLRGIYQHVHMLRRQRHKYWMNDNQYIRIIEMFAFLQTGFSTACSRIAAHTHIRKNILYAQPRSENSHRNTWV